jgi:hypothetical protein
VISRAEEYMQLCGEGAVYVSQQGEEYMQGVRRKRSM